MKTLSEWEWAHGREAQERWWQEFLERERKLLSEVEAKNIPLYEQTDPTDHYRGQRIADTRREIRASIRKGNAPRQGVACDNCGTELVDRKNGSITCSDPPLMYVGCPGCGWIGYKTA